MAESTKRALDIVIAARDETEEGVKSAIRHLNELSEKLEHAHGGGEGRKGVGAAGGKEGGVLGLGKVKELLEGAGVIAGLEGLAKALHGVAEAQEEVEKHGLHGSEAFGKLLEGATRDVPVLGQAVGLFTELRTGAQDAGAALYRLGGGSKEVAESMMSAESQTRLFTERLKEQAQASDALRASMEQLTIARLHGRDKELATLEAETRKETDEAKKAAQEFLGGRRLDDLTEDEKNTYKTYVTNAQNVEKIGLEKLKDLRTQYRHEDEEHERQHQAALTASAAAGLSAYLGAFSTARAQRSADMAAEKEARQQAIRDEAAAATAAHPDQAGRIREEALQKQQAVDAEYHKKALAFQKETDRQREDEAFASDQRLLDRAAGTQAEMLRIQHRDAEADLVLRKRQRDREEAEENRSLERLRQAEGNDPNKQVAAKELSDAEKRAAADKASRDTEFGAEQMRLQKQAANDAADRRLDLEHGIARLRIDTLREEASLGNQLAAKQAEQLALAEKYAEKRDEINRLLRDQGAILTDQQKQDLRSTLAGLDADEAAARNRRTSAGLGGGLTLPGFHDDSHLTGIAQAQQAAAAGQADQQQKLADVTAQLVDFHRSYLQPLLPTLQSLLPSFTTWINAQIAGGSTPGTSSAF